MALVAMKELLEDAQRRGYAVGYFESWNLESVQAVVDAAEEERSPIIIGFGGDFLLSKDRLDKVPLEHYAAIGRAAAETARVPVALLLNETSDFEVVIRGVRLGFTGVMFENPKLNPKEHTATIKEIVRVAHAVGVSVEAMSGELGTSLDGTGRRVEAGHLTDPEETTRFAEETGVDALAVAIGNVHTLMSAKATIDFDLLAKIREATDVPLVAHGGTGFAYNDLQKAIRMGICKVNVGAIFKRVYIEGMKALLDGITGFVNPHDLLGAGGPSDIMTAGKLRMKEKARELIRVCGSDGKA